MARSQSKPAGKSRIRFIMLEADLSEGDLSEVTAAIQNALRPRTPQMMIQRADGSAGRAIEAPEIFEDLDDILENDDLESSDSAERSPQKRRKPTYRTPNVVALDFNTSPSLKDFVAEHPPETLVQKHLVILAWAKEASEKAMLNVDEVYTSFRHLSWPSGQKDFSQPLRDLKKRQLIVGNAKDGFEINHIGLGEIEKLKR